MRYNGGHVKDDFLVNTLGQYVQWVPVCPEVEMGMGVPRENVRLVGDAEDPGWLLRNPELITPIR